MNLRAIPPLILLAACSPAAQPAAPLAGAKIGGPFRLTDQDGRIRTDRDFAGRYRIMYFGYTFCPDVCPTDMAAIGGAMRQLRHDDPALAARIAPIFVTVDPARDTPAVVKQFVGAFGPGITGLTGTPDEVAPVAKAWLVSFNREPAATPGGGYLVAHSRATYLMDPANRPLALLPSDQGADAVLKELKRWAT